MHPINHTQYPLFANFRIDFLTRQKRSTTDDKLGLICDIRHCSSLIIFLPGTSLSMTYYSWYNDVWVEKTVKRLQWRVLWIDLLTAIVNYFSGAYGHQVEMSFNKSRGYLLENDWILMFPHVRWDHSFFWEFSLNWTKSSLSIQYFQSRQVKRSVRSSVYVVLKAESGLRSSNVCLQSMAL